MKDPFKKRNNTKEKITKSGIIYSNLDMFIPLPNGILKLNTDFMKGELAVNTKFGISGIICGFNIGGVKESIKENHIGDYYFTIDCNTYTPYNRRPKKNTTNWWLTKSNGEQSENTILANRFLNEYMFSNYDFTKNVELALLLRKDK